MLRPRWKSVHLWKAVFGLLLAVTLTLTSLLWPTEVRAQGAAKTLTTILAPPESAESSRTGRESETAPSAEEIQKLINLLENEETRAELVRLLKSLSTLEASGAAPGATAPAAPSVLPNPSFFQTFRDAGGDMIQKTRKLRDDLLLSVDYFLIAMAELNEGDNPSLWLTLVLSVNIWALICLSLAWWIEKRHGFLPHFQPNAPSRLWALLRYMLRVGGPMLVLIISCFFIPPIVKSDEGLNWMLRKGLSFIQDSTQGFFIIFPGLYLAHKLIRVLLAVNEDGLAVIKLPSEVALRLINTWKVLTTYLAVIIYLRLTLINNFAMASLPHALTNLLILPLAVYITIRVLRVSRILRERKKKEEAGRESSQKLEETAEIKGIQPLHSFFPEYKFNRLMRAHWPVIIIFYTWALAFTVFFWRDDSAVNITDSLLSSFIVLGLGVGVIWLERVLMLHLVAWDTSKGRNFISAVDYLSNLVIWATAVIILVNIWGLPFSQILQNPVTRDIFGRALTIFLTIAALIFFFRFSRSVAARLRGSSELTKRRIWRTMGPLLNTSLKALAVFVALVVILERLGVSVGPILAGAGILGLAIGMGAQTLIKDLINGISMLLMDSMVVGDYVEIGGVGGTVEFIGFRTVRLRDLWGNLAIIPNSSVDVIVNRTKGFSQEVIDLLVPYDADPDLMLALVREVSQTLDEDEYWSPLMTSPVEVMGIYALNENGTTIRIRIHTMPGVQWAAGRELKLRLKRALLKAGIKAPYKTVLVERGGSAAAPNKEAQRRS